MRRTGLISLATVRSPLTASTSNPALKRTGGNRQRYESLLRRFAAQQATTVEDIRKALSMGDAATAERAAHSLKGAAGTLGAIALSEAAAKAETAIRMGQGIDAALTSLSIRSWRGRGRDPRRAAARGPDQWRRRRFCAIPARWWSR